MRKIGTISGIGIFEDPKLKADEARMVSTTFNRVTNRMEIKDEVRIVNLKVGDRG